MTKSELIEKVALAQPGLTRKEVEAMVNALFDILAEALRKGERVELRGFGSFSVKHREARMGRNPKTGEAVHIPAKRLPYFKPGKELRERVDRAE